MKQIAGPKSLICTCLLSPRPRHPGAEPWNMPRGGFWSFQCLSEAPSSCYRHWTSGWASRHASLCPETKGNRRSWAFLPVYKTKVLYWSMSVDCRSYPTSLSVQSHRDTAVTGLLGCSRRSFRGTTLLLSSLRAARRCSFLCTAGSSPWRYCHISTSATQTRLWTDMQQPEACSTGRSTLIRMTK